MSRSWSVVKFLEDGCVEAVPSLWLDDESSSWPPIAAKMVTALIKKCEPAALSWPKHPIKVLTRVPFDTYLKAREKVKLAEDTSDLQSDEPPSKRRRIIPKSFWSSEDSGNEIEDLDKSTQNIDSFNEEYLEERLDQRRSGGRSEDASIHSVLYVLHGRGCSKPMKRRACHG